MGYECDKIDFPCPQCQQKFQVSLHQLFPDGEIICPVCGVISSDVELSELNKAFKQVEIELLNIREIMHNRRHIQHEN